MNKIIFACIAVFALASVASASGLYNDASHVRLAYLEAPVRAPVYAAQTVNDYRPIAPVYAAPRVNVYRPIPQLYAAPRVAPVVRSVGRGSAAAAASASVGGLDSGYLAPHSLGLGNNLAYLGNAGHLGGLRGSHLAY